MTFRHSDKMASRVMGMEVLKLAAFSEGAVGGNPAGVCLLDELPEAAAMQDCAKAVGFSETAFACKRAHGWQVRYFTPTNEVPFCGHATIALGAALAMNEGNGVFPLQLNEANITVEGQATDGVYRATLQSPPTRSAPPPQATLAESLDLFGLHEQDLNPSLPPRLIHGGADHLALILRNRASLSAMQYDFEAGKSLMIREGWITIMLAYAETERRFHSRNVGASVGIYEDPATGAATAAFAGYLNDIDWPHQGEIECIQGEDMGARSKLQAQIPEAKGASIRVSGNVRLL